MWLILIKNAFERTGQLEVGVFEVDPVLNFQISQSPTLGGTAMILQPDDAIAQIEQVVGQQATVLTEYSSDDCSFSTKATSPMPRQCDSARA